MTNITAKEIKKVFKESGFDVSVRINKNAKLSGSWRDIKNKVHSGKTGVVANIVLTGRWKKDSLDILESLCLEENGIEKVRIFNLLSDGSKNETSKEHVERAIREGYVGY